MILHSCKHALRHLLQMYSIFMMAMLVTHHPAHRMSCRFMRDLPYSIDILAENVLDPSHVPFSHHGMMGNFMTCLLCIACTHLAHV